MDKIRDKNGLTEEEFLEKYKEKNYPRPYLTADIVVIGLKGEQKKLLLIQRGFNGAFDVRCSGFLWCRFYGGSFGGLSASSGVALALCIWWASCWCIGAVVNSCSFWWVTAWRGVSK